MKLHFGLVVVALSAIGCGVDELDTGETEQAAATRGTCPDPENCTLSNGGGVYTQELGNAHIGPNDLMLTHFINQPGGGVTVEGREFNGVNGYFKQTSDGVGARYFGVPYSLFGVFESATIPQFRLARDDGSTFNVPVSQIAHLELIVRVNEAFWTLSFRAGVNYGDDAGHGQGVDQLTGGPGSQHVVVRAYDMFWNPGLTLAQNPTPYCHLAQLKAGPNDPPPPPPESDPVVFLQGITVNAVNAIMTPNMDNYVTLSCLHGALATARWWGYDYHTHPVMFEAAMHMKRASYCGDDSFYTRRNTTILIHDTINNLSDPLNYLEFEASWGRAYSGGPIRALCVNTAKQRRPNALYPPQGGADFVRTSCVNAPPIPDCPSQSNYYPTWFYTLASQKDLSPPLSP